MAPLNGFNSGTDLSLSITNVSTGANVTLDGRWTHFEDGDTDRILTSEPCDNGGVLEHKRIPGGHSGTIEVDRSSGDFESMQSLLDDAFYSGLEDTKFTIQVTKPNSDGTDVRVYQYAGVVFHGYKGGSWQRDAIVKPRVEWIASRKHQIA